MTITSRRDSTAIEAENQGEPVTRIGQTGGNLHDAGCFVKLLRIQNIRTQTFVPKDAQLPNRNQQLSEPGRGVLTSLRRIIQAVDLYSRRLSSQYGLTGPQLLCLREMRAAGVITPGELARVISLSPPTISGILDRLEARELITRHRRERDKRQIRVQLTTEGARMVAQAPLPLQEVFLQRLTALPATRQHAIAKALDEVVELMQAQRIDAAPILERGSANPALTPLPVEPAIAEDAHQRASGE